MDWASYVLSSTFYGNVYTNTTIACEWRQCHSRMSHPSPIVYTMVLLHCKPSCLINSFTSCVVTGSSCIRHAHEEAPSNRLLSPQNVQLKSRNSADVDWQCQMRPLSCSSSNTKTPRLQLNDFREAPLFGCLGNHPGSLGYFTLA